MFIEYSGINLGQLLSNFVWILGASIILAAFSYHEFLSWQQKIKRTDVFRRRSFKKSLFLGLTLLTVGLIFSSFNLNKNSSSSKFMFMDYNIYEQEEPEKFDIGKSSIDISTHQMEMNKKYPIRNNKISMLWNGYVETPFIKFVSGLYTVEFEAYGSEAKNEFSKIVVAFLVLENKKLNLYKLLKAIELNNIKKKYTLKFEAEENQMGKIRIQFFNDSGDEKGRDRNVWIGGVKIRKLRGRN